MPSTVYLHSRRTLVASWRNDSTGPILSSYVELSPTDIPDTESTDRTVDTVVVSSESWFTHSYPTSPHHDPVERQMFEMTQICGFDKEEPPQIERRCELNVSDTLWWTSLIGVSQQVLQATRERFGQKCVVISDLEADISMALRSIPKQGFPWLLYGRRGNSEVSVIIGEDHTPRCINVRRAEQAPLNSDQIRFELSHLYSRFQRHIRHVVVFGDYLTAPAIEELRRDLRQSDIRCIRLQPFRLVSSDLEADASRRVISRAHVIAPLMYVVRDLLRG